MRKELKSCPYPDTCRYFRAAGGEAHCLKEVCPFRIHSRRLVAGEIHRLCQEQELNPQQARELEVLKVQYARLLRGGDRHDGKTSQTASKPPRLESGGGAVFAGV